MLPIKVTLAFSKLTLVTSSIVLKCNQSIRLFGLIEHVCPVEQDQKNAFCIILHFLSLTSS